MAGTSDATDWAIPAQPQQNGRVPLTELGRRVDLGASATTERVKRLEGAVNEPTAFGSTTTGVVRSQTLPYGGVSRPS